jgi:hypothetical protein
MCLLVAEMVGKDYFFTTNAPHPLKTEMPLDVTTHQEALPYSPFTTTTKGFSRNVQSKFFLTAFERLRGVFFSNLGNIF